MVLTLLKDTSLNEIEICKFKAHHNTRWYEFCWGSISKHFTKDELSETILSGTVYDFSADHSLIEKQDILNIYEFLMIKNNMK